MTRRRGYRKLFVFSAVLAVIWLIALPWLTALPHTRRYLERLDAEGIDPAAMYYTELPPHLFADAPQPKRHPSPDTRNSNATGSP